MKVILINVKNTDRYHGYWTASSKELEDVDVVVGHNNKELLNVYELKGFFNSPKKEGKKEFDLKRILGQKGFNIRKELSNVNLKGLQGVKYVNI